MVTQAPRATSRRTVTLTGLESPNLDTICYRGAASLADLALISQPDVFDQVSNPNGLQRGLSPRHAQEAYQYASREQDEEFPRAFPEVILNVRDEDVINVERVPTRQRGSESNGIRAFRFTFDLDTIAVALRDEGAQVVTSRVDGNHRLFFAGGDDRHQPINTEVPFQLHIGLTREQEANLFVDVNANQKGLNSSHLHYLRSRLTPDEVELRDHPERVFAARLAEDEESPWHGLVYMGGSKEGSKETGAKHPISLVTLESGVKRTMSKSQYVYDLTNHDAQYVLIRNFWNAVRQVLPEAWDQPEDFLLLRNIGVLSMGIFGATVIDRVMSHGRVDVEAMVEYVEQTRERFNWSVDATMQENSAVGMSGNRAALAIAGELASELVEPGQNNALEGLQERLLAEAGAHEPRPEEPEPEEPDDEPEDDEPEEEPEEDESQMAKVGARSSSSRRRNPKASDQS
jgi:DGQHR domain-containing protein